MKANILINNKNDLFCLNFDSACKNVLYKDFGRYCYDLANYIFSYVLAKVLPFVFF